MKLLILLTILCASCSSPTKYRPTIYGHDYKYGEIVKPITHERISCRDEEFNKYVSFSLKDFSKIALLLEKADVPYDIRIILEKFEKELKQVKRKQSLNPHIKPKR